MIGRLPGAEDMSDTYRVRMEDGYWKVTKEGAKRALRRFDLRQDAIVYAQDMAKRHAPSRLQIHQADSPLSMRYTYP